MLPGRSTWARGSHNKWPCLGGLCGLRPSGQSWQQWDCSVCLSRVLSSASAPPTLNFHFSLHSFDAFGKKTMEDEESPKLLW